MAPASLNGVPAYGSMPFSSWSAKRESREFATEIRSKVETASPGTAIA